MSSAVGDLVATLNMNVAPFQSAINTANQAIVKLDNVFGSLGHDLMKPFSAMADTLKETFDQLVNLVNPVNWLNKAFQGLMYPLQWCMRQFEGMADAGHAIEAFERVEDATARLGAAMKNAGDKVGVTMAQIQALTKGRAGGLEGMATLVEAGLGGSTLTGAYASAKDLAAMMKTDIPAAAGMMATALEFPERAARTLREAHIRLSDTQQEAIETLMQFGDQAGAQTIILSAVAEKTDGVAAAMRGTLGGQMREFSATVEHLSEIFGKALAPSFEIIIALFKDLANWVGDNKSTILAWGDTAAGAVKAVTEPLRELIALLRAGEMDSAFLYLQVGWSRTVDRFREGTEVVKTFFGHLGEFLLDLFESIALGIEARVKRMINLGQYKRADLDRAQAYTSAVLHHDYFAGTTSAWTGQDSAQTQAAQAAYDKSKGAAALAATKVDDQFTKDIAEQANEVAKSTAAKADAGRQGPRENAQKYAHGIFVPRARAEEGSKAGQRGQRSQRPGEGHGRGLDRDPGRHQGNARGGRAEGDGGEHQENRRLVRCQQPHRQRRAEPRRGRLHFRELATEINFARQEHRVPGMTNDE